MKNEKNKKEDRAEQNGFPGYPHYSAKDDIYRQEKEESEIDPEQTDGKKAPLYEKNNRLNEKNFRQDKTGGDLDVPGSELDDTQENIGSEDEENNIYSKGDNQ